MFSVKIIKKFQYFAVFLMKKAASHMMFIFSALLNG